MTVLEVRKGDGNGDGLHVAAAAAGGANALAGAGEEKDKDDKASPSASTLATTPEHPQPFPGRAQEEAVDGWECRRRKGRERGSGGGGADGLARSCDGRRPQEWWRGSLSGVGGLACPQKSSVEKP